MPRARSGGAGTRLPFRWRLTLREHPSPSPLTARPASVLADAHGCWAPLRSVAPRRRSERGGQANVLLRAVGMVRVRYPTPRNSRPACAGYSLLLLTSRRTSGRIVPPLPQTTVVQSRSQGLRLARSSTLPAFAVGVPLRRAAPDTAGFRRWASLRYAPTSPLRFVHHGTSVVGRPRHQAPPRSGGVRSMRPGVCPALATQ